MNYEKIKFRRTKRKIDKKLINVLAERFILTKKIGEYKKEHNLEAYTGKREEYIFKTREKWAKELDLDPVLIKTIFTMIIEKVKENHQRIKNSN